jgi:hypothetical protein
LLGKHIPTETNTRMYFYVVCVVTVAMWWHGKDASITIEGLYFLHGLAKVLSWR